MEEIYQALCTIRAPLQQGEYDLHRLVMDTLAEQGILAEHEAPLGPRCRIDIKCGRVGIEIKRGKPAPGRLMEQLARYAQSKEIDGLILVVERSVDLPRTIGGKPIKAVCLNRLWGIAL